MGEASVLPRGETQDSAAAPREDNAKRRQVMDGARRVFMAEGFDGASMNEIARAAGVSKGTLYVYFASKDELFAALIREDKRAQAEQLCKFAEHDTDLPTTLRDFGLALLDLMLRPTSISHLRTVVAVAGKSPGIGQAFYEAGPEFGMRRLARFFDKQVELGLLDIEDTAVAAVQFMELCKAPHHLRAILGVCERPSDEALTAHVVKAVDMFLKVYGPPLRTATPAPAGRTT